MAKRIVVNVKGNRLVRSWQTGRNPLPAEIKARHKTISLHPKYYDQAVNWKDTHGIDFSSWVENMMYEENKKVCIETV